MSDNPINKSIFEDLEIDVANFLTMPEQFAEQVYAAAKRLEQTLDSNTSVSQVEIRYEKQAKDIRELPESIDSLVTKAYEFSDTGNLAEVFTAIEAMKQLVRDMENAFHDRCKEEAAQENSTLANKKLAQIQHKRLRETFDQWRGFVKAFLGKDFTGLKSKPGNYQASITDTLQYVLPDGGTYYNHFAVAKKLGIYFQGITFADIMEYCEAHPDQVEIKRIKL